MIDKKRMYENMKRLVSVPSVSGSKEERKGAFAIESLLYELDYFKEHKDKVKLLPLFDDLLDRSIVVAFLEIHPGNPKTVILSGHYDVVDVEEYGHLQDIAYDVEEITKRINEMPLDEDTLRDYESGEWIFGRGTADMKYGHALCLELLDHYSKNPDDIDGNLLYVAVCGEETNSEGMLRAIPFFNEFAKEKKLDYEAFLLTECYMMEDQARDKNHYIHYGSSGKIMPMFFFVGESTHFGEPFLGLDPNLMSAKLYNKLQLNTDFCQTSHGVTTPPPACLKMMDLKNGYSASIPLYAAAYYSMVTVDLDPEGTLEGLRKLAEEAMEEAIAHLEEKASTYEKITGEETIHYSYKPVVYTFEELLKEIREEYDGDFDKDLKDFALEKMKEGKEIQSISVDLVKKAYETYKNKRPMIIISFIPPFYPDSYIPKNEGKVAHLMEVCDHIIDYAEKEYNEPLKMKNWYMGISDMCYTGLQEGRNFDGIFQNLVGKGSLYQFPADAMKDFKVPGIVMGGYGKDFHKHTERLNRHYNFEVLPNLYIEMINELLKK
jgi:arginine utilization protein RocB